MLFVRGDGVVLVSSPFSLYSSIEFADALRAEQVAPPAR